MIELIYIERCLVTLAGGYAPCGAGCKLSGVILDPRGNTIRIGINERP